MTNVDAISGLLKPIDAPRAYPPAAGINQVQNDDEGWAKPIVLKGLPQGSLFAFNSRS
jgi:hypothetical protein